MSVDVRSESIIMVPPQTVAAFAMEAENDPRWIGGIKSAHRLTEPPTGVGTRVARQAIFMGRRIEYVLEVTDYDPPERIAMRSIKGPFPMLVTYEFEARGGGTLASIRVQGDAGGFYRIASPLLAANVKRSITRDLERLQSLVEAAAA